MPHVSATVVDPFIIDYDPGDAHSRAIAKWAKEGKMNSSEFSAAWANALVNQQTGLYGCRYGMMKHLSSDAAKFVEDGSVDVLFIDGLHTYEGALADVSNYWPKMKNKGLVIFNDWGTFFPGVKRAACEFVTPKGFEIIIGADDFGPGQTNAAVVIGMQAREHTPGACADG